MSNAPPSRLWIVIHRITRQIFLLNIPNRKQNLSLARLHRCLFLFTHLADLIQFSNHKPCHKVPPFRSGSTSQILRPCISVAGCICGVSYISSHYVPLLGSMFSAQTSPSSSSPFVSSAEPCEILLSRTKLFRLNNITVYTDFWPRDVPPAIQLPCLRSRVSFPPLKKAQPTSLLTNQVRRGCAQSNVLLS